MKKQKNSRVLYNRSHIYYRLRKIFSLVLVCVMCASLLLPINGGNIIVNAKQKKSIVLIIGGSNRSMIAKSKNGVIYTYRSSNEKVASVSKNGVVTGKKKGKVNVIRYKTQNRKTSIDKVQAYNVKMFSISGKKTVYTSGKYQYKTNAKGVTWKCNKKKKAKVTKKGVLKAKKTGTVVLTAKLGKHKATKKIVIKKDVIDHIEANYNGNTAYAGNTINPSELKVYAVYKSGNKKRITDYKMSSNTFGAAGKGTYTISYGKFSTKFTTEIQEKKVKSLQVSYLGNALAVGQSVNPNQLNVIAVYNDGSTKVLSPEEFTLTNAVAQEKGNLAVIVTHTESKIQATVNVSVSALSIMGVDTNYTGGIVYTEEGVDPNKIKILVTYEDGSTALVDASDIRIGSAVSEDGKVKVLLYYTVDGVEYSTILSVEERNRKLTSLKVESERPYAFVGKDLNRDNFIVKAVYSDGEEKLVTDWVTDYVVSDEECTKEVRFEYSEDAITVSSVMELQVKDMKPQGIKVVTPVGSVKEGAMIDYDKLKVALCYEGGLEELISGFTTDFNQNDKTTGDRTVTITYGDFTTTTSVYVEPKVALSIGVSPPTGVTIAGQQLNTTGMSVVASFDNGTEEVVTGWTTDYSTSLPAGKHAITVTYQGVSSFVNITVENPLSVNASAAETIVRHGVTINSNSEDVTYSIAAGNATLSRQSGSSVVVTPAEAGTVVVRASHMRTGEVKDIGINAIAFKMSYENTAGGNAAENDILRFTTNANAQFKYVVDGTDGNTYTGGSNSSTTVYNYTAKKLGTLTVTATDSVSGVSITKTVVVRKALEISGPAKVKVGEKITLTTTKQVVNWSSSNTGVATINSSGVVKGVKAGTVTITAKFPEYGNRTVTKKITVTK